MLTKKSSSYEMKEQNDVQRTRIRYKNLEPRSTKRKKKNKEKFKSKMTTTNNTHWGRNLRSTWLSAGEWYNMCVTHFTFYIKIYLHIKIYIYIKLKLNSLKIYEYMYTCTRSKIPSRTISVPLKYLLQSTT